MSARLAIAIVLSIWLLAIAGFLAAQIMESSRKKPGAVEYRIDAPTAENPWVE